MHLAAGEALYSGLDFSVAECCSSFGGAISVITEYFWAGCVYGVSFVAYAIGAVASVFLQLAVCLVGCGIVGYAALYFNGMTLDDREPPKSAFETFNDWVESVQEACSHIGNLFVPSTAPNNTFA